MIRGLLSSALRAATSLKLTPKKYFVFFWGPRGGRQGWGRTPKRFAKKRLFGEFSGFPKIFFAKKDFWEKEEQALKPWCLPQGKYLERAPLNGVPAKIFAKQKDFWEKEEQALKPWCLPQGKYPKRALKMGPPQRFLRSKKICGERSGGHQSKAANEVNGLRNLPRRDVVPPTGLEPIRLPAQDPKSCASANFATAAYTPPLAGRRAIFLS